MENGYKILFVCLGNICRSPAAEGIMRRMLEKEGLAGRIGARRGISLTHRSRKLSEEDFGRFDRIVVMDDMNYEDVHRLAPSRAAAERIFRMTEFCRRHPDRTCVPDSYYEGHEGFELVLDLLEDACEGLLEDIKDEGRL